MLDAIRRADAAASTAHDFIYGKNGVTKKQASDAIWTIHNALRPLLPLSEQDGYTEATDSIRDANSQPGEPT